MLSDAKIKALKPKAKQYKTSDYDGLYILTTPSGGKLWKQSYRLNGKENTLSHGPYPAVNLAEARKKRDDARALIVAGIDPNRVKREVKEARNAKVENSFNSLADKFINKATKEGRAPATLSKLSWLLQDARNDFGHLSMNDITPHIVLKTLRKREVLEQYETANKMMSRIGAVFRFAVASQCADMDPTASLRGALISPTVKHRAAITDPVEFGVLLNAIDNYGGAPRTIIGLKLLIQFACRPIELRKAKWDEFDWSKREWLIPAERMKMRKPHKVPLSDYAIMLLKELEKFTGHYELLLPAQTSSKKPISENTFNQALVRMGYTSDRVVSHGFRATFATLTNESGLFNPDAIEAYSARRTGSAVRKIYNRARYWEDCVTIANWWSNEQERLKSEAKASGKS
jgi:integrase